ncbi:general substrate transporter [Clavulina sp. PMI_390]|nr:general substrate transporter [Clavulina sp. PMI_390]
MAVPLYNGEISPPEVRGSLIALQQLSIVFGIMVSFWIDYGTNYIGGTGQGQSDAAWRVPLALQLVPAIILGVGMLFMPHSPRWLVGRGREDEALAVLANVRKLPAENEIIQLEFLEIKAEHLFEKETSEAMFPQYQDGSSKSELQLTIHGYLSLLTSRPLFRRVAIGSLVMFFQQWTGVNAILYYAPSIFVDLGLTGNTTSLLATGVVGIVMFLATIPTVIYLDRIGRRPIMISGAFIMATCHIIVAILTARFQHDWPSHKAAGWVACVLVWIFAIGFGYSWGPGPWVLIAEIFPLSVRGKGLSIAASSNWMNNFIVGQVTPNMIQHLTYGTFIFFGVFSFLGGLFVMFFVPETKGYTLEEMDEIFGAGGTGRASEDQARLAEIQRRLGLDKYAASTSDPGVAEHGHIEKVKEDAAEDEKSGMD